MLLAGSSFPCLLEEYPSLEVELLYNEVPLKKLQKPIDSLRKPLASHADLSLISVLIPEISTACLFSLYVA